MRLYEETGKLYFCVTCVAEKKGRSMSEAESLIHHDNYPGHEVVNANEEALSES